MSMPAFVRVEGARQFVMKARLVDDALEVVFADGARGTVPAETVRGRHRNRPVSLEIPTPHGVIVRFGRTKRETFPWDYLRGFCDPDYEAQARVAAEGGSVALGRRIRALRRSRGWSQAALAERASIGRVTLVRIESGAQSPGLSTLDALAAALDIPFADLVAPGD